ncbi:MAG: ATP-binding protein [Rhodocyclaceae bacterium]
MLLLRNLSFRYKIPLRASALVLVTAVLLTTVLVAREREELQRDLEENALLLGHTLVQNLVAPVLQDDVWRAFELLRAPLAGSDQRAAERLPFALVLFDRELRVLASSDPARYPLLAEPEALPRFRGVAPWVRASPTLPSARPIEADDNTIALVLPIIADGVTLGHLALGYGKDGVRARAARLVERSVLYTLLLLAFILPITWYWGRRMARPLVKLAGSMGRIGPTLPGDDTLDLEESGDEIGRAGTAFRRMLHELRQKDALEREVMISERLAAVGRLAAGVAHEINNPLGGMLNALDTYKRHGDAAKLERTLSLIERGLLQIRDTVSALLVEARPSGKPLSAQDFEDVHTLLAADVHQRGVFLEWHIELPPDPMPLAATLVRQVLLNLLLNAVQSTPEGGRVNVHAERHAETLKFSVTNEGPPIPPERIGHLFEPFASDRPRGHGLGLWVSYQIIQQLRGRIAVASDLHGTRFLVELPLHQDTES